MANPTGMTAKADNLLGVKENATLLKSRAGVKSETFSLLMDLRTLLPVKYLLVAAPPSKYVN